MNLTKTLLIGLTLGVFAQPSNALGMQTVKDFLGYSATKIAQSLFADPVYKYSTLALSTAVTAGLGWYLYNAIQTAKRTYYIGDQKFVVPEGAKVPRYTNTITTPYKDKFTGFFDLTEVKFAKVYISDQIQSNAIIAVHDSYGQGIQKPGVRVTVYSNNEINWPIESQIQLRYDPATKALVIEPKNAGVIGRIDCIFTLTRANIITNS